MAFTKPPADIHIDEALVRALLQQQHPDLASRPLAAAGEGWDNAVFRLGDDLAVRLPRRAATAALIEHEQQWLPQLASRLPLPVPSPVRVGHAGAGFLWSWSIVRWFPGKTALVSPPEDPRPVAVALGEFLRALHQRAPPEAPHNPWRSIPLDARTKRLHEHLDQLRGVVNRERVLALWDRLVVTPRWQGPPMWIHGDMHPGNLLIDDDVLTAVIDFGDMAAGDPATDLSVMWMLLPPASRADLFAAYGSERASADHEHTWRRARGWALALGVAYMALGSEGNPLTELGKRTIEAALSGD